MSQDSHTKVAADFWIPIADTELLENAVRTARARGSRKQPRWVGVMDAFLLGSTYAHCLCRRFGLDPDEMVKK